MQYANCLLYTSDSETIDKSTDKDVTSDYLATLSDLITSLNK